MSTVSEKLLQVAQNNPKVYHSGQLNIVKNAECLKEFKSDTSLLLDDVSPVEHEMGVRVHGKNLLPYPYEETTLTRNGVTWTDNGNGSITISGTTGSIISQFYFSPVKTPISELGLKHNSKYVFSIKCSNEDILSKIMLSIGVYDKDMNWIQPATIVLKNGINFVHFIVLEEVEYITIQCYIVANSEVDNITIYPQIEFSEVATATEYTPYVPDLTAVKVRKQGKNLLNLNRTQYPDTTKPTTWDTQYYYNTIRNDLAYFPNYATDVILNKDTGTLSCKIDSYASYKGILLPEIVLPNTTYYLNAEDSGTNRFIRLIFYTALDGSSISYKDLGNSGSYPLKFTTPENCNAVLILFASNGVDNSLTVTIEYSNIVLSVVDSKTYEPYITPTEYIPTADGTVNGVTSLYPNTTLMTDTDGVMIDCEYYKDIDKTFNELTTSVALSGGES